MKKLMILTFLIVIIPFIIIIKSDNSDLYYKIKYGIYTNKKVKVKRVSKEKIEEVNLEKYVIGVVAGESPASFHEEALKAQAVASRSYVLNKISNNTTRNYDVVDTTTNQVYLDDDDMKEKWKQNYQKYYNKIKNAVQDTRGEVLIYDNQIINAMFFSTSNGFTENSKDVFNSDKPYLRSVDSSWDKTESPAFSTSVNLTTDEFLSNLGLNGNNVNIGNIEKTQTGRVKTIVINGKRFSSDEIRRIFGLKSTSFEIIKQDKKIVFNVKGFGHGVGMSQYGSNGMAKDNKSYKEILAHYYKNSKLKKVY